MTPPQSNGLAPLHLRSYGHRSEEIKPKSDPISHLSTLTSLRLGMMLEISVGSLGE